MLELEMEAREALAPRSGASWPLHGLRPNRIQAALHLTLAVLIGMALRLVIFPEALLALRRSNAHGKDAAGGMSFLIFFGISKALSGLLAGRLASGVGRKKTCLLGWFCGMLLVPVFAVGASIDSWIILHVAHVLLGMHQGIAWAGNIICLMDLLGPHGRGLASGLSNAAGYLGSAVTAPLAAKLVEIGGGESAAIVALGVTIITGLLTAAVTCDTEPWFEARAHDDGEISKNAESVKLFFFIGCGSSELAICAVGGLVVNAATGIIWGPLVTWCQAVGGLSSSDISKVEAIHTLSKVLAMVVAGAVVDTWVSPRAVIRSALWTLTFGLGLLTWQARQAVSWPLLLGSSSVVGVGVGAAFPALAAAVVHEASGAQQRAIAYGAYRMWRDFGYALGGLAPSCFSGFEGNATAALLWAAAAACLALSPRPVLSRLHARGEPAESAKGSVPVPQPVEMRGNAERPDAGYVQI